MYRKKGDLKMYKSLFTKIYKMLVLGVMRQTQHNWSISDDSSSKVKKSGVLNAKNLIKTETSR